VKIVNNRGALPDFFDVEGRKKNWMDTKNCQLCDIKYTLTRRKHN
jgi:hypothetical protein